LSIYNSLEAEYKNLANKYSEAQAIIYLEKSETLEKDKLVQIPAGSSACFAYNLSYTGYLVITFSAVGNVYFYVGNGSYWVRYPSGCNSPSGCPIAASSGSFIVPVLPGTTYVRIYTPSIYAGSNITITVTYVY